MIELQILVYGIVRTALIFDFLNEFHHSANSIATVVGTRVLKPIQAVAMASVANFIGPFVFGNAVATTVKKGIIQPEFSTIYVIFAVGKDSGKKKVKTALISRTNRQTQIHMAALMASISVLVFGSINAPFMIHAQNTNSTLSNATTAESHTTNTTGTPFNTTASSSSSSPCLAKDTTIIVDVYSGMTRTIHFKANQTSNTVQGIGVVLKC